MRLTRRHALAAAGLAAFATAGAALARVLGVPLLRAAVGQRVPPGDAIPLPPPRTEGAMSVEASLATRRSLRSYRREPLTLSEVGQLLWAAQGVTDPRGFRAAPSAGALYPLELYLVSGHVDGLEAGIYRYYPDAHAMSMVAAGDVRDDLARASLGQSMVRDAAVNLVMTAVYARTTVRYGYRGHQYVHMEIGHAGENIYLQATAAGLGTVAVGAFDDAAVSRLLHLPEDEVPLYIMPVGRTTDG